LRIRDRFSKNRRQFFGQGSSLERPDFIGSQRRQRRLGPAGGKIAQDIEHSARISQGNNQAKIVRTNQVSGITFRRQSQNGLAGADIFEQLAGKDAAVGRRIVDNQQRDIAGLEIGDAFAVA